MAAKVFQIIAAVLIVLFLIALYFLLRFVAKALKKLNKSLGGRSLRLKQEMRKTIGDMDETGSQLAQFAAATAAARESMDRALESADRAVAFLKSNTFQFGVPAVLCFLLLVVATPRGAFARTRTWTRPEPVEPPSWEEEEE